LFFNFKSFGKVIFLITFATTVISCGSFNNKARSSNNKAEINFHEKPKILDISATVIWDGSQTLGGNWVSHPNIKSPERVLIKNTNNGKSVVGAVFQQTKNLNKGLAAISSDAAKALRVSKNNETKLQIVAVTVIENSNDNTDDTSTSIEKNQTSNAKLTKPFIQVGIFGVENNAIKTGNQMSKLGLQTNTFDFEIKGKTYWRVVAGPAKTLENKKNMLNTIKSAGFTDAYFVSN
jgi:rare lipoprotein A